MSARKWGDAGAGSAAAASSSSTRAVNWGDVDGDGDDDGPMTPAHSASASAGLAIAPVVPVVSQSKVDAKGIKTVVEFGTNAQGEKIRITRKIKVSTKPVRVNRHVLDRQQWEKFGDCKGVPRGPEQNITYQSFEIIHLDLRPKKREEEKDEGGLESKLSGTSSIVVCRNCGETGHWTLKCPKRQNIVAFADKDALISSSGPSAGGSSVAGTGSKYVPMHMREGAGAKPAATMGRDDAYTLRVTNLSEEVTEADLQELISRFGHTQRIYLARDRQTGESRGFAFVNFSMRQDAERCIEKLNGHGYANLILHVEWAKPREERERPAE